VVWGRAVQIGQDDGEYPPARGADSAEKARDRGPAGAAGPAERAEPAAAAAAWRVRVVMGCAGPGRAGLVGVGMCRE